MESLPHPTEILANVGLAWNDGPPKAQDIEGAASCSLWVINYRADLRSARQLDLR